MHEVEVCIYSDISLLHCQNSINKIVAQQSTKREDCIPCLHYYHYIYFK